MIEEICIRNALGWLRLNKIELDETDCLKEKHNNNNDINEQRKHAIMITVATPLHSSDTSPHKLYCHY